MLTLFGVYAGANSLQEGLNCILQLLSASVGIVLCFFLEKKKGSFFLQVLFEKTFNKKYLANKSSLTMFITTTLQQGWNSIQDFVSASV